MENSLPLAYFNTCPNEILENIFHFIIPRRSVLSCRSLNKRCRDCIDSSASLQYRIKLDLWGYEDTQSNINSVTNAPIAERLACLEKQIISWATLDWQDFHLRIPAPSFYVLSQGYLFTLNPARNAIDAVELPSRGAHTPLKVRRLPHNFDFQVASFAADPSQNLLVILEKTDVELGSQHVIAHFVSLWEDCSHPQTEVGRAQIGVISASEDEMPGSRCDIFGRSVAIQYRNPVNDYQPSSSFFCWLQWTSGKRLLETSDIITNDYLLVNESVILYKRYAQSLIEVRVVDEKDSSGRLQACFLLPRRRHSHFRICGCSTLPNLAPKPLQHIEEKVTPSAPFFPLLEREFVGLITTPSRCIKPYVTTNFFAPIKLFTREFEGYKSADEPIPFEVWTSSPECREVVTCRSGIPSACFIQGARFVTMSSHLEIWDLNKTRSAYSSSQGVNLYTGVEAANQLPPKVSQVPLYAQPLDSMPLPPHTYILDVAIDNERIVIQTRLDKSYGARPGDMIDITVLAL